MSKASSYEIAIKRKHDDARAWYKLGNEGGGMVDGTSYTQNECYGMAIKHKPDHASAWFNLGNHGGGTVDGTSYTKTECYGMAIKHQPDHASAWYKLGVEGGGTVDGAPYTKSECLGMAIKHQPDHASAWYKLGVEGGGKVDGAPYTKKECYGMAINHKSDHDSAWFNLGNAGGGTVCGTSYTKKECYGMAITHNHDHAKAWDKLGNEGGGMVDGTSYTAEQCHDMAIKHKQAPPTNTVSDPPSVSHATFELTKFAQYYSRKKVLGVDEVWETVGTFLKMIYMTKFSKSKAEAKEMAKEFRKKLVASVNELTPNERADPNAELNLHRALCLAQGILARMWTSPEKCPVSEREWCSLLNEGIRDDSPEILHQGELLEIVATMNLYCVKSRGETGPPIPWPSTDDASIGKERWTLWRGGRLPRQHFEWYRRMAAAGGQYRVNMFLPTSVSKNKAVSFMKSYSTPQSEPMVLYTFRINELLNCDHVNCMEAITAVEGEEEFLFPPYSGFTCTAAADHGMYFTIEADVLYDNRTKEEGGPIEPGVPLAPWA